MVGLVRGLLCDGLPEMGFFFEKICSTVYNVPWDIGNPPPQSDFLGAGLEVER